jgi:hypothetical protein
VTGKVREVVRTVGLQYEENCRQSECGYAVMAYIESCAASKKQQDVQENRMVNRRVSHISGQSHETKGNGSGSPACRPAVRRARGEATQRRGRVHYLLDLSHAKAHERRDGLIGVNVDRECEDRENNNVLL